MIATIYNETYNEIGAAYSWHNVIEFICMRAVMERGKEIITYVYPKEDEELTSRIVARCEIETNKIKIDWQPGDEAARAAIAAKQSEVDRAEITD